MSIVTTLSYEELGTLIRNKRICLNNSPIFFGVSREDIDEYFKSRVGYSGYILGIQGELNTESALVLAMIDSDLSSKERLIIEADIRAEDILTFDVDGVNTAAEMLYFGMDAQCLKDQLDNSLTEKHDFKDKVQIVCIPCIENNASAHIKIASLGVDIKVEVENITVIRLQ